MRQVWVDLERSDDRVVPQGSIAIRMVGLPPNAAITFTLSWRGRVMSRQFQCDRNGALDESIVVSHAELKREMIKMGRAGWRDMGNRWIFIADDITITLSANIRIG